jgi:signal peptidase I
VGEPAEPAVVSAPGPLAPLERHRVLETIKDNIEAFTIALIMALVIKHFCVEAFKIPTGSMEPTLLGEKNHPVGDRILVDKLAYMTSEPSRWDVMVFLYPLNKSKHFIKRVAGVGEEWIRILRGDIWFRKSPDEPWRIATKPRRVRESLYEPVFPAKGGAAFAASDYWEPEGSWRVVGVDDLRFEGGDEAAVHLLKRFGENDSDAYGGLGAAGALIRDLRFRMRLRHEAPTTLTIGWHPSEKEESYVRLAPPGSSEGSLAGILRPGRTARAPLDVEWTADHPLDLEMECVDGQLHVRVDDHEVAMLDEQRSIEGVRDYDDFLQDFTIEADGGPLEVSRFRVGRDIQYQRGDMDQLEEGDLGLHIPPHHYFMLGDNTGSSHDSRMWELHHVPLKDGREIVYTTDRETPVRYEDGWTIVVDVDGIERRWRDEDVKDPPGRTTVHAPFVPRELVVGRAFLIFWPVLPDFPGRFGFIR